MEKRSEKEKDNSPLPQTTHENQFFAKAATSRLVLILCPPRAQAPTLVSVLPVVRHQTDPTPGQAL